MLGQVRDLKSIQDEVLSVSVWNIMLDLCVMQYWCCF
jgi:hypothetical protein